MALDYYKLEPHRFDLVPSNRFKVGREGRKPRYIVRHHLMMVNATGEQVRGVWLDRPASAHYTIQGAAGRVGQVSQHVYDANTAFANADWVANLESYTIEHSNNTGRVNGNDYDPGSWNISDDVLKAGARWAAALLVHDKMGPPVYGSTIRDHNMFTSTGCPVHLSGPHRGNPWGGKAGKYHQQWMDEAVWFYDQLSKKLVNPDGAPLKMNFAPPKETMMADFDTKTHAADGTEHTYGQLLRYTDGRVFTMESETLPRLEKKIDAILKKLDGGEQ